MNNESSMVWLYILVPASTAKRITEVSDAVGISQNSLISQYLNRQLDMVVVEESVRPNAIGAWERDGGVKVYA